ncbi:MAG: hypothetical protein ACKOYM_09765 [Actinomycetes bacterium]
MSALAATLIPAATRGRGPALVSVTGMITGVSIGGDSTLSRAGAVYVATILVLMLCGLLTVWWFWELLDGWQVGADPAKTTEPLP